MRSRFTVIAAFDALLIALLNEAIERLVRQEQNARIILDNSPAGMIAVDANGVITVVNNAVKKIFGYEDNELIGQHIELLVPASIRAEHVVLREMYLGQATARAMGVGRDLYGLVQSFPLQLRNALPQARGFVPLDRPQPGAPRHEGRARHEHIEGHFQHAPKVHAWLDRFLRRWVAAELTIA